MAEMGRIRSWVTPERLLVPQIILVVLLSFFGFISPSCAEVTGSEDKPKITIIFAPMLGTNSTGGEDFTPAIKSLLSVDTRRNHVADWRILEWDELGATIKRTLSEQVVKIERDLITTIWDEVGKLKTEENKLRETDVLIIVGDARVIDGKVFLTLAGGSNAAKVKRVSARTLPSDNLIVTDIHNIVGIGPKVLSFAEGLIPEPGLMYELAWPCSPMRKLEDRLYEVARIYIQRAKIPYSCMELNNPLETKAQVGLLKISITTDDSATQEEQDKQKQSPTKNQRFGISAEVYLSEEKTIFGIFSTEEKTTFEILERQSNLTLPEIDEAFSQKIIPFIDAWRPAAQTNRLEELNAPKSLGKFTAAAALFLETFWSNKALGIWRLEQFSDHLINTASPKDAAMLHTLAALVFIEENNIISADKQIARANAVRTSSEWKYVRARLDIETGQPKEAFKALREIDDGNLLFNSIRKNHALSHFEWPTNYDVKIRLGDATMLVEEKSFTKKMGAALPYYQEAVQINPARLAGHVRLADIFAARGDIEKSVEQLKIAVEKLLKPEQKKVAEMQLRRTYINIANTKSDSFKFHEAAQYFDAALKIKSDAVTYNLAATTRAWAINSCIDVKNDTISFKADWTPERLKLELGKVLKKYQQARVKAAGLPPKTDSQLRIEWLAATLSAMEINLILANFTALDELGNELTKEIPNTFGKTGSESIKTRKEFILGAYFMGLTQALGKVDYKRKMTLSNLEDYLKNMEILSPPPVGANWDFSLMNKTFLRFPFGKEGINEDKIEKVRLLNRKLKPLMYKIIPQRAASDKLICETW